MTISNVRITEGDGHQGGNLHRDAQRRRAAQFSVMDYHHDQGSTAAGGWRLPAAAFGDSVVPTPASDSRTISACAINSDKVHEADETFEVALSWSNCDRSAIIEVDARRSAPSPTTTPSRIGGDLRRRPIAEGDSGTKVATFGVLRSGGTTPFSVNCARRGRDGTVAMVTLRASGTLGRFGAGVNVPDDLHDNQRRYQSSRPTRPSGSSLVERR